MEVLNERLSLILSSDIELSKAETHLQSLAKKPEYPVILLEFLHTGQNSENANELFENSQKKLLSAILLKNFVYDQWGNQDYLSQENKIVNFIQKIRSMLLQALAKSQGKTRDFLEFTLQHIAGQDFQEDWQDLFTEIQSSCRDNVEVLEIFNLVLDSSNEQLAYLAEQLIPIILQILTPDSTPDQVELALTVLYKLMDLMSLAEIASDTSLLEILQQHWDSVFQVLKGTLTCYASLSALNFALKSLIVFYRDFGIYSRQFFSQIMQDIWILLQSYLPVYLAYEVFTWNSQSPSEFENELFNLYSAVSINLLELISILVLRPSVAEAMQEEIPAFINCLALYCFVTYEQQQLWETDTHHFIFEEETEESLRSTRVIALKLISDLVELLNDTAVQAIIAVAEGLIKGNSALLSQSPELQEYVQKSNRLIDSIRGKFPVQFQWKIQEVGLLMLSQFASDIVLFTNKSIKQGNEVVSFDGIVSSHILPNIQQTNSYLFGRLFHCVSRILELFNTQFLLNFFEYIAWCMSNVKDLKIKLSACYAANRISRKLQSVDFDNITIIETILKETCELVKNTTQDTKVLGLETLLDVSSLNIEAGKKVPSYGSSIFLELYTKYFGDNQLGKQILAVIRYWSDIPDCIPQLTGVFIPYILSVLLKYPKQQRAKPESIDSTSTIDSRTFNDSVIILPSCFEIASILLRKSHADAFSKSQLIELITPLLEILKLSEDVSILLYGTSCLRTFIAFAAPEITKAQLSEKIIETTTSLLNPAKNESGAIHLGYTIVQIFSKLSPQIDEDLLIGCLEKIYRSKMPSSIQGLVLVFARLIHEYADEIIGFLANQSVDRRVALKVLLDKWLIHQPLIRGRYTKNATITALARLYTLKDSRLESLLVVGFNPSHSNIGSEVLAQFKILCTLIRCLDNESHVTKRRNLNDELGYGEDFQTVVEGSGLGMAGEFDSGARMDTVEDDHTSDLGSEDPMESMKRDLWSDVKDDYDIQDFNIPESKDKGLADYEIGSECLMSDMLDFDYEDNDDMGEDFFEDDMYSLGDWYGGITLQNFLLDFFNNLIEHDRDYLRSCMKHLLPDDLALMKKHFNI